MAKIYTSTGRVCPVMDGDEMGADPVRLYRDVLRFGAERVTLGSAFDADGGVLPLLRVEEWQESYSCCVYLLRGPADTEARLMFAPASIPAAQLVEVEASGLGIPGTVTLKGDGAWRTGDGPYVRGASGFRAALAAISKEASAKEKK